MADKKFDPVYEVHALAGETLAIQAILNSILPRLAALSPDIRSAISSGLDEAANLVEHIAIKHGDEAHPAHTAKALQIVEAIRSNTLGKRDKPKGVI